MNLPPEKFVAKKPSKYDLCREALTSLIKQFHLLHCLHNQNFCPFEICEDVQCKEIRMFLESL